MTSQNNFTQSRLNLKPSSYDIKNEPLIFVITFECWHFRVYTLYDPWKWRFIILFCHNKWNVRMTNNQMKSYYFLRNNQMSMSKQNTKPSIRCLLCFEGGLDVIKRLLCFKLEAVDYYFSDAELFKSRSILIVEMLLFCV